MEHKTVGRSVTTLSRRRLLAMGAATASALRAQDTTPLKICIFSKHLQWLPIPEAAALAAEIGFDGVDITVRNGGHVLPDRVAVDLPKAVDAIKKTGLNVPMITTEIVDAATPYAEDIVRTASQLNIRRYRWLGFRLIAGQPIPEQLQRCQARTRELAALNKKYGVCAMYHTHSGPGLVGASIWDLYLILKDLDTSAVGVNYDVGHATVEGGLGGWINTANLTFPMMRGIALKDFYWRKRTNGKWTPEWCAIGDGMVRFEEFFRMLRNAHFSGPVQLHLEYAALGGADQGKKQITIDTRTFVRITRQNLDRAREMMRSTGLI